MKDYYNTLGVNEGANEDELKKAYRSLAMKHHPDRGGDQAKFQEIQEAYDVLTNPQKKAEWEAQKNGFHQFGHGHPGGGFHFNFGGGNPFEDIFRNFHQGGDPFNGFQRQRRNRDLRVAVELDLVDTLTQQTKYISVKHINGTRQTVTVEVPRGASNQTQMKYAGHGDHTHQDLPPGDLYIEFRIKPNPDFYVEGIDLIRVIKLNCIDAITGTSITVKGLDGREFEWSVPVGSQHGAKFRIQGQGLWALDQPIRGSLILLMELTVPTNLTTDQLQRLEAIRKETL